MSSETPRVAGAGAPSLPNVSRGEGENLLAGRVNEVAPLAIEASIQFLEGKRWQALALVSLGLSVCRGSMQRGESIGMVSGMILLFVNAIRYLQYGVQINQLQNPIPPPD